MKRQSTLIGIGVLGLAVASVVAADSNRPLRVATVLRPVEEVPVVSSTASGFFKATFDTENETITFELSYDGIEGSPTQAHIHLGQNSVNGGVSVFLCTNLTPPAGAPVPVACPASPATITGTLTAADVVGPGAQGIAATEFAELVAAVRKGLTYANVHSAKFPGGEIRGQLDGILKK